jgi:hypothetical protein
MKIIIKNKEELLFTEALQIQIFPLMSLLQTCEPTTSKQDIEVFPSMLIKRENNEKKKRKRKPILYRMIGL